MRTYTRTDLRPGSKRRSLVRRDRREATRDEGSLADPRGMGEADGADAGSARPMIWTILALMRIAVLLLLVSLAPSRAAADALAPPPTDCPAGSVGQSAQVGTWCEPTECGTADGQCPQTPFCPGTSWPCSHPEPWSCSDVISALCVRHETRAEFRRPQLGPQGPPVEREIAIALGPCGQNDACAEGATCERARRCVHAPPAPMPAVEQSTPATEAPTPAADRPASPEAPPSSGCACGVVAPRPGLAWTWGVLGILALRRRLWPRRVALRRAQRP